MADARSATVAEAGRVISLEDAFRIVDETLAGVRLAVETVPTRTAVGRVLAREQQSYLDLPPFDKAAVDGYAIGPGRRGRRAPPCRQDACGTGGPGSQGQYRVVQTVAAGQAGVAALHPGETVKVMTGAPVPAGTTRVVMQEEAEQYGEFVKLKEQGPSNFCKQGEDMKRGDVVLPAGIVLRALDVGNLVGCGITSVEVFRRPRLAIISTGNEIVDDPALLTPGRIMNINGPMLAGLCVASGLEVSSQVSVLDTPEAVSDAVHAGLSQADIVILSGGVSVGEADFVLGALERVGLRLHFTRVAVKPGKPTAFATVEQFGKLFNREGKMVFGLPGNPVSVFLMFHVLVLRAVARLTGGPLRLRAFTVPLGGAFRRRHAERAEYVPACLTNEGRAEMLAYHGSAHLLALTRADGFVAVPFGIKELPAGASVEFFQLPGCSQ
ncbi:MAG: molybdopterin molybdotransferase MoeA [Planctomycetota bacterium]|nr:molybdopterin molybdotransferase MoeA [Planctomycetota bacterium]